MEEEDITNDIQDTGRANCIINTTVTGSVPTPTPTGTAVFDGTNLYVFGGTWKTFTPT